MALQHERLADEPEHQATKGGVFVTIALAFVAVVAVNAWAVRWSPASARSYDGLIVANKWDLASKGLEAGGIAVVGDSSGNFAVVASTLGEGLGAPAVNLCTFGRFIVTGARWSLDHLVASSKGPPSVALVVLGTQTFVKDVDGFTYGQMPVGVSTARAGRAGLGTRESLQFAVARYFPLFTQSSGFSKAIREHQPSVDLSGLAIDPDGSAVLPYVQPDAIEPHAREKAIPEILGYEGPVPSEHDRAAIEQMIQDADARGYDIVFVDGPIWGGLATMPEQVELAAKANEYLDAICATSDRAWHLPGPVQTFEAAEMENPFHINRPAAERFTAEVVRRLKSLGLPR